jgi:hypothetical protein
MGRYTPMRATFAIRNFSEKSFNLWSRNLGVIKMRVGFFGTVAVARGMLDNLNEPAAVRIPFKLFAAVCRISCPRQVCQ